MKRAALLLMLSLAALAARAQSDEWVPVATGDTFEYHGQRGSARLGDKAVSFILRTRRLDGTGQVQLGRAVVRREDCARRAGTLYHTDLAVSKILFDVEFAFGAGTVASVIAERVCGELRAEQPTKSQGVQL